MHQPRRLSAPIVLTALLSISGMTLQAWAQSPSGGESSAVKPNDDGQDHEDPREALKELMLKDHPPVPVVPHGIVDLTQELRADSSDRRRLAAGRGLAAMAATGDAGAMASLVAVLNDESAGKSRVFAAIALRDSRSSEAVGPLIEILDNRALPQDLRKQAALSLGALGDARALQPLLRATDDPTSPDVRYYANVSLTQPGLANLTNQPALMVKLVRDREQPQFRRARAASLVAKLGDATAVDPLVEVLLTEPRSPEIKPESSDPTSHMFSRMMDKQRNIRAKIAVALGVHGDGRVVVPLLKVMSTSADDPQFMRAGQSALAKVAKRSGMDPFAAALKSPDAEVRRQTVAVVSELERVDKEGLLKEALKDDDPEIKAAAAAALAKNARSAGGVNAQASDKK
jgi:HEAT repeat protein